MNTLTLNTQQIQATLNHLVEQPNGLNTVLEMALNAFMKAERSAYLADTRNNKGNGYRPVNGLGIGQSLSLQIPRDRLNQFKPWILTVMQEQTETLHDLCFELYSKGLTTRDIEAVTDSIYGQKLSRSAISRITESLYDEMRAFREQTIQSHYPIIYLDATYVKTKRERVSSEAYYVVLGVLPDMTREVIGLYNAPTESATRWNTILHDLKARGLEQTNLVVIDDLTGLDGAIERHFDTAIQKCVLHLKRQVLSRVKKVHRQEMVADLASVFRLDDATDTQPALTNRAKQLYDKWSVHYSHLSTFNDQNKLNYYCTYLEFEPDIRNMIYTTNWIERLNKSFKRTLKIRNSMPNVNSVLTLLSKVAIDMNNSTYAYPITRLAKSGLFVK